MTKRTIIVLLISVCALLTLWFFTSGKKEITNYPPKGNTIVAFGDSLVFGVGASDGNDFVSILEREINLPIENFGVSGDTTEKGLSRINEVISLKPDIVILLLGGNDAIRRISMKDTENNLRKIIEAFQSKGAVVLLLGVKGGLLGDPYDTMYERLADDTGSIYVENVLKGLFADSKYMSDAIHPNDLGYLRIAERILPVLKKLII